MKILFVEDHLDSLQVISQLLTKRGHEVLAARTVAEAKRLCETTEGLELLICDIVLPDGEGWQLAHQCGIPAIALTGLGMRDDQERSKKFGFAAHVLKPVSLQTLEDAIKAVVPARKSD